MWQDLPRREPRYLLGQMWNTEPAVNRYFDAVNSPKWDQVPVKPTPCPDFAACLVPESISLRFQEVLPPAWEKIREAPPPKSAKQSSLRRSGFTGPTRRRGHMSYSLNSLKGGYIGDYIGNYYRAY